MNLFAVKEVELLPNHLDELERITNRLPDDIKDFGDFAQETMTGITVIECIQGHATGYNLYHTDEISIARWVHKSNTIFNKHQHDQHEFFHQLKGEMDLYWVENEREQCIRLYPESFKHLPPGTVHWAVNEDECEYIATCQPANQAWPH